MSSSDGVGVPPDDHDGGAARTLDVGEIRPPDQPTAMNNATGKRLLALVRDGDYAHPGEEEANALLFAGVPPDPGRRILDAGCGSGGTAAWVQERGYGIVTGIEIDAETVRLAQLRHPEIRIVCGDLQRASTVLDGTFDFMYAMTALYAVPDQSAALEQLRARAEPCAELRLLEYSDPRGGFSAASRGRTRWEWWRPLGLRGLPRLLDVAGWRLVEARDLAPEFERWYVSLCDRIAAKRDAITRGFGRDWYEFASAEYAGILAMVRAGSLGGVFVRAAAAI